jgi:hypothetical protein
MSATLLNSHVPNTTISCYYLILLSHTTISSYYYLSLSMCALMLRTTICVSSYRILILLYVSVYYIYILQFDSIQLTCVLILISMSSSYIYIYIYIYILILIYIYIYILILIYTCPHTNTYILGLVIYSSVRPLTHPSNICLHSLSLFIYEPSY